MPYRVRISAQAQRDLELIYEFIEAATSDHAAIWFNGLREAIATLNEMPQRLPITREDPGTRHLLYGNKPHIYRVLYRIDERSQVVNILNIRHGARSAFKTPRTR